MPKTETEYQIAFQNWKSSPMSLPDAKAWISFLESVPVDDGKVKVDLIEVTSRKVGDDDKDEPVAWVLGRVKALLEVEGCTCGYVEIAEFQLKRHKCLVCRITEVMKGEGKP